MADNRAIALLSDVGKDLYKESQYYQIAPLMFQKINEKISGKCGNQRSLLIYLIVQKQNDPNFRPSEATILKACHMDHSQYVRARAALVELKLIEYEPNKYIKILYKNLME